MTANYIHYRSSLVHYLYTGKGGNVFICFHGYGETAASFKIFELPGEEQTIIAIDFPYHGATAWNETGAFTVEDLDAIIQQVFEQLKINTQKFSLVGYSMGGRVALAFTEKYPLRIHKLILLAPDGLKINFWYRLATQTSIGNALFRLTMQKPGWFMWMLRLGNRIGIINPSIFKFTHHYIDNPQVRKDLYERWTGLRKIKPNLKALQHQINAQGIKVFMFFGKHDRIILSINGERFAQKVRHCEIIMLSSGHRLLDQKNLPPIFQIMRS